MDIYRQAIVTSALIDYIIEGGKVVYDTVTIDADVAIDNGKILAVGSASSFPKAEHKIDAADKYVIPGGVDPHVHLYVPLFGTRSLEGWDTGTMALAVGGTTSMIDFAGLGWQKPSLLEGVKARRAEAEGKAVIDYGLHAIPTQFTTDALREIPEIVKYGVPTFKIFMMYRSERLAIEDGELVALWKELARCGGMMLLHAENAAMTEYNVRSALRAGKKAPIFHYHTKSNIVEAEAINRAIFIADFLKVPLYNVHMSIKEGVKMYQQARKEGKPFYCETITHYLVLTKDKLEGPRGYNFVCSPPLRTKEDQDALWRGLSDGVISTVGSDQAAYSSVSKKAAGSFDKIPNGLPGMEFRIPILFSEGVLKGRISLNRFVAVTSTNAARIFGLYPRKGVVAPGSDADLVVMNPRTRKTISIDNSLYDMDWYPYEGMSFTGWPEQVFVNGKLTAEKGKFVGGKGGGRYIPRKLPKDVVRTTIA